MFYFPRGYRPVGHESLQYLLPRWPTSEIIGQTRGSSKFSLISCAQTSNNRTFFCHLLGFYTLFTRKTSPRSAKRLVVHVTRRRVARRAPISTVGRFPSGTFGVARTSASKPPRNCSQEDIRSLHRWVEDRDLPQCLYQHPVGPPVVPIWTVATRVVCAVPWSPQFNLSGHAF